MPEIHGNTEGIRKTVLDELTTLYDVQLEPGQFMPQDAAGRYRPSRSR